MIPAHISQNQRKYTQINTHEYMLRSFVNKGKHYFSFFLTPQTLIPTMIVFKLVRDIWICIGFYNIAFFLLSIYFFSKNYGLKNTYKSIKALHFKESNKWKDVVQNLEKVSKKSKGHFTVHVICSDCHCTVHTICSDCHFTVHTICSDCHCK